MSRKNLRSFPPRSVDKPTPEPVWRLILNLSSPDNHSVKLGQSTLLAKIDIVHSYRNIPVHPSYRLLLGMQWDNTIYVDTMLPFALGSAPKVFSALADSLEWILLHNEVSHVLHYLDDFFTAGAADTSECRHNLDTIIRLCEKLGFPLAADKIEGPSPQLVFLGILLDSHKMEMRLPEQKLIN